MNFRAYLNFIVITFSFLGILSYQQDAVLPNQEIVLDFSNGSFDEQSSNKAIEKIKSQLQCAGVEMLSVHVQSDTDGKIVISYFSESDVAKIKSILAKDESLALEISGDENKGAIPNPSEEDYKTFIQVFEIYNGSDVSTGIAGKLALEHATEQTRFVNPTSYIPPSFDLKVVKRKVEVAHLYNLQDVLSIDDACHIIPEVRAGPELI